VQGKPKTIKEICDALLAGDCIRASQIAREEYPFTPLEPVSRKYSQLKATSLFVRDGFIDRYLGSHLVFPGTLRLLALLLPAEFPWHPHGKMSVSHIVYWELFPTLDHVVPVARGGADSEENLVTTSMLRNSAKSNWTLDELGWHLLPPGDCREWDGLLHWFLAFIEHDPSHLSDAYTRAWHTAASRVLAKT
jgi:hypothetical protein